MSGSLAPATSKKPFLVFLDIDGTLLKSDYSLNDSSLPAYMRQLQDSGQVIFALNSNRSIEDLLPIADLFGIKGDIIGENGLFSYNIESKKTSYFAKHTERQKLMSQKNTIEKAIQSALNKTFPNNQVLWRDVDTVDVISHGHLDEEAKEGAVIALNNVYRKFTISTHIFRYRMGELVPVASENAKRVVADIRQTMNGSSKELTVTHDQNFSNILMYSNKYSKLTAVKELVKNHPSCHVVSIGDEINDFKMSQGVGDFYAVANAHKEALERATYVAEASYALGVKEILHRIVETTA